jgi:hypothetical protein
MPSPQSGMHHEQLELLRDQAGDMKVLLLSQTTAQTNLQRLLERVAEKL